MTHYDTLTLSLSGVSKLTVISDIKGLRVIELVNKK